MKLLRVLCLSFLLLWNVFSVTPLTTFGKVQQQPKPQTELETEKTDYFEVPTTNSNFENSIQALKVYLVDFINDQNKEIKSELNTIKSLIENPLAKLKTTPEVSTPVPTQTTAGSCEKSQEQLKKTYVNCEFALRDADNKDGLYLLNTAPLAAYCQRFDDKGFLIVFRRHYSKETQHDSARYHNWESYRNGFGNLNGDYWLGLENMHQLTKDWTYELWMQLKFTDGTIVNQRNGYFKVDSEKEGYRLHKGLNLSEESADNQHYGDVMSTSYEKKFSTYDQDNDMDEADNCAKKFGFAWWYNNQCDDSVLTGATLKFKKTGSSGETTTETKELTYIQLAIRNADM